MFYGVLAEHILTHLQLILLGQILAFAGLHVGGSPSASLPAIWIRVSALHSIVYVTSILSVFIYD